MKATHYVRKVTAYAVAACGKTSRPWVLVTTRRGDVTCKSCLKRMGQ